MRLLMELQKAWFKSIMLKKKKKKKKKNFDFYVVFHLNDSFSNYATRMSMGGFLMYLIVDGVVRKHNLNQTCKYLKFQLQTQ